MRGESSTALALLLLLPLLLLLLSLPMTETAAVICPKLPWPVPSSTLAAADLCMGWCSSRATRHLSLTNYA